MKGNTVGELLKTGVKILEASGIENSRLDAEVILAAVLGVERYKLYVDKDKQVDIHFESRFLKDIEKRRLGMPLQYITGKQEFFSLEFFVGAQALIPRPETELLVEKVLNWVGTQNKEFSVCDIGTGSGCIAVTIAKHLDKCRVIATDISEDALEIAKRNAKHHGVLHKIEFLKGDVFEPLEALGMNGKLDVIVSNPPYIPAEDLKNLQREVRDFEPLLALDGGRAGLELYKKIIPGAPKYLKPKGLLALELGFDQGKSLIKLAQDTERFENIKIVKDYSGRDRIFSALRKED